MNESKLKDFVEYIDTVFYQEPKDVNAIKNSIDIFFEFYKKNNFNSEIVFLIQMIKEKLSESNLEDRCVEVGLACAFLGLSLGKYSKKIKVENYGL